MGITVSKKSSHGSSVSGTNDSRRSSIPRSQSENNDMPRKLWWSPKKNVVEIHSESIKKPNARAKVGSLANIEYRPHPRQVSIQHEPVQWQASPRIDSLSNTNWSPSVPRGSIRHNKLKWNAQSKINSLDNVNYQPSGGHIAEIYDEKLDFKHVPPRVNCGFLD